MNRRLVTGLLISAVFVTTGAAVAGLGISERGPPSADVPVVPPVQTTRRVAREKCEPRRTGKRVERCRTVHETKQLLGAGERVR